MASDFLEFNHPSGKNGEERRGQRGREWGKGGRQKSANYTDMLPGICRPINMSLRGIIYRWRRPVPRSAAVYTLVCAPGTDASR